LGDPVRFAGSETYNYSMATASDDDLERRLTAARPEPSGSFVRELEASLFATPHPERSRWRAWRPVFAAGAVTAALGLVTLVLSLIGLSPLQGGGNDPASAEGCVTLSEPQWVTRPTLVPDRNGEFRMANRKTRIYRQVTRCP
jgi:hypothetical protein